MPLNFFDKVWRDHLIADMGDGVSLLQVDRLFLHDMGGSVTLQQFGASGRSAASPRQVFTVIDHLIDTRPGRGPEDSPAKGGAERIRLARKVSREHRLTFFDVGDPRQGIVHVISPELGVALPGLTLVCGDSHTCTIGALGALAWGIGSSEAEHVLATQTLMQAKPRSMRITLDGALAGGSFAKDLVLHLIGRIGAAGGIGYAVEFAGSAVRSLPMEARFTLCNMAIEFSAKYGFIAPDDTTYEYLADREFAPRGAAWDRALAYWRGLPSDMDAAFDRELHLDCSAISPQVTWGTSPQHVVPVDGVVPDPSAGTDPLARRALERAAEYMQVVPGTRLADLPIDAAYIGSCTNSRLSDLRAAASVLRGRKVRPGVLAICVPGSTAVRRAAEAEGLDRVFIEAGFEWHESGCGYCGNMGGNRLDNLRVVTTTNRNFEGRQGERTRSHLASPATVAASAVCGRIADPRPLLDA